MKTPNRVQVIAVTFSFGPKTAGAQLEWRNRVIETFDFQRPGRAARLTAF